MKKVILIAAALLGAGIVFLISLAMLVNARGGLPSERAGVAQLPLIGGLFEVQGSEPEGPPPGPPDEEKPPRMSFLRYAPQARLQELAQELSVKRSEYDSRLLRLDRRDRELHVWEQQLEKERENLRKTFEARRRELARREEEISRRQAELQAFTIKLEEAEEKNLKTAAEIYGKMEPTRAADFFTEMYGAGQEDTVVKIVYLMRERDAAKVLGALQDATITADITERLKRVTRETEQEGG